MPAQGSERHVPEGVVERLPVYLNALLNLHQEGRATVPSSHLGELTGVNPAQIRRDLAYFGSFGTRGMGYDVPGLIERIQKILGSDHAHEVVLVGAGNLGTAIAEYQGLRKHGFIVSAVFDADPARIGTRLGDLVVQDVELMDAIVAGLDVTIGVLAVPASAAQAVTDRLAAAGVQVILNYTPVDLRIPAGVTVHNADPVQDLLRTLYHLSHSGGARPKV